MGTSTTMMSYSYVHHANIVMDAIGHSAEYVHAIAAIIDELIAAYNSQNTVNMTRLKNDIAKKYKLPSMPKV